MKGAESILLRLKSWFTFQKERTLLSLKCLGLRIILWEERLKLALLIAAKRLLQRLGGHDHG